MVVLSAKLSISSHLQKPFAKPLVICKTHEQSFARFEVMSKSFAEHICKGPESFALSSVRFQQRKTTQHKTFGTNAYCQEQVFCLETKKTAKTFLSFLFFKNKFLLKTFQKCFCLEKRAIFKVASFWQIFKVALQSKMQSTFSLLRNINNLSSFLAFPQMQLPQSLLQ